MHENEVSRFPMLILVRLQNFIHFLIVFLRKTTFSSSTTTALDFEMFGNSQILFDGCSCEFSKEKIK